MTDTRDQIAFRLHGTPCAVCGQAAAFISVGGLVHHQATIPAAPCKTRPFNQRKP